MEYIARVNPRYFAGIERFAAVKDVRFYLCGVFIEPHPHGGVTIVATDGHCMAAVHDPDGWCAEPIIVGDITKLLLAACKRRGFLPSPAGHLWIAKDCAVVSSSKEKEPPPTPFGDDALHSSKISIIDGKFPDWLRVMPVERQIKPAECPPVNPSYMAKVSEALRIMQEIKYSSMRLYPDGDALSVVIRTLDAELMDRFVALVMPCRADRLPTVAPEFVKYAPAPKPKVKPRYRMTGEGWQPVEAR